MEFQPFPKIARLNRDCTITEKIDGTNAQVMLMPIDGPCSTEGSIAQVDGFAIFAGSRTRWVQPGKQKDNHGFAGWVVANAAELVKLGEGSHFGEWWGGSIQSGYGLKEKRFSLFNTYRWNDDAVRPACCYVVPTIYQGPFSTDAVDWSVTKLRVEGSQAAPGWKKPEGIIVFHHAKSHLFKVTLERDDAPKSLVERAA